MHSSAPPSARPTRISWSERPATMAARARSTSSRATRPRRISATCCSTSPNPTSQPGAQFGAAVAGIGDNVIVGAPTDDIAGRRSAASICSTARPGSEITSIANPDPATTTGFGSAVASVGLNILIGSPDDNDGAGAALPAAFLYDPRGRDVAHDVRSARRRRRRLRRLGRRHAEHGIDRRPGRHPGHERRRRRVPLRRRSGEPDLRPGDRRRARADAHFGDAFGTAVGFDDGALIVGAAGAMVREPPGPRPSISISPVPDLVSVRHNLRHAAPYDSVILSGTFMDANPSATLTASIDWGDGSAPTVVDLPAGSYAFAAPHDYTTDPASGSYTIGVTLSDTYGETAFAQTTVAISNPAPAFASPGLVLSSSSIVEGGTVNGQRNDREPRRHRHQHGLAQLGRRLDADHDRPRPGQDTFSTTHTYLSNPAGVGSGSYTISRFGDQSEWPGRLRVGERHRQQGCPAVHRGRPEPVGDDRHRGRHDHARRPVHRPGHAQLVHRDDRLGRRLGSDRSERAARPGRRVEPRRGSTPTRPPTST